MSVPAGSGSGSGSPKKLQSARAITNPPTLAWPEVDSAVLVIHGIGDQQPLSTLDQFCRQLKGDDPDISVEHHLVRCPEEDGRGAWFDNLVRMKKTGGATVDVREFYWAHRSRRLVPANEILDFIRETAKRGARFYREKPVVRENEEGFHRGAYFYLLGFVFAFATASGSIVSVLKNVLGRVPFLGALVSWGFLNRLESIRDALGDVVAYTATDQRSSYFEVRQKILGGVVGVLSDMLHPKHGYKRVAVIGHSLGSQIAVDAINRLNLLVCQGALEGYDAKGKSTSGPAVAEVLSLLCTFGSPVDKIAFFFRSVTRDEHPLRARLLENFHGFRQVTWPKGGLAYTVTAPWQCRVFEDVRWVNYFCRKDLVSGGLDYFTKIENVRLVDYRALFPHSRYWTDPRMFREFRTLLADPKATLPASDAIGPRGELFWTYVFGALLLVIAIGLLAIAGWGTIAGWKLLR